MLPVSPLRYTAFLLNSLPRLAAMPCASGGRDAVLDAALCAAEARPGVGLEFGVYKGRSLRHSACRHPTRQFHGFDSLNGFPKDGRQDWHLDFSLTATPLLPRNCRFHAGWFSDTVPPFSAALDEPVALINLDCDIYSSASTVLSALRKHLKPGLVLHLDEALNYDTWLWNEMLALFQMLEETGLGLDWLPRGGEVRDLPQTLRFLEAGRYPTWSDDVAAGFARQVACVLTPRNTDLADLEDPARRPVLEDHARRLADRHAAYLAGTQVRQDCNPHDPWKAPPLARPSWRRWLRLG